MNYSARNKVGLMCDDDGTRCLGKKKSNVTSNISESSATVYKFVNYKSLENMKYDLPYKIMRIGKGWTPYGVKVKIALSGNGENFTVSLAKRYVVEFNDNDIFFNKNLDGEDCPLTLTRKKGTKREEYHREEYHIAHDGVVMLT